MKNISYLRRITVGWALLGAMMASPLLLAQATGRFTLSVRAKKSDAAVPILHATDLVLTVNNQRAHISSFAPVGDSPVELLIAIDDGLRGSFSNQFGDLKTFLGQLPANVRVALGYMEHGRVALANSGFTADHAAVIQSIRTPSGISGVNGSPYFVISDVARHWPSRSSNARRELLVITDGVDRYTGLRYDPQNPYFQKATQDARNAGVLVDSIYYSAAGLGGLGLNSGESYLQQLANETGGYFFNEGMSDPVSISLYLGELKSRLANQYAVEFTLPKGKPAHDATLKVRLEDRTLQADAQDTIELKGIDAGK